VGVLECYGTGAACFVSLLQCRAFLRCCLCVCVSVSVCVLLCRVPCRADTEDVGGVSDGVRMLHVNGARMQQVNGACNT
jgi:hypothetical protein